MVRLEYNSKLLFLISEIIILPISYTCKHYFIAYLTLYHSKSYYFKFVLAIIHFIIAYLKSSCEKEENDELRKIFATY